LWVPEACGRNSGNSDLSLATISDGPTIVDDLSADEHVHEHASVGGATSYFVVVRDVGGDELVLPLEDDTSFALVRDAAVAALRLAHDGELDLGRGLFAEPDEPVGLPDDVSPTAAFSAFSAILVHRA
jgi:hypothetical protein